MFQVDPSSGKSDLAPIWWPLPLSLVTISGQTCRWPPVICRDDLQRLVVQTFSLHSGEVVSKTESCVWHSVPVAFLLPSVECHKSFQGVYQCIQRRWTFCAAHIVWAECSQSWASFGFLWLVIGHMFARPVSSTKNICQHVQCYFSDHILRIQEKQQHREIQIIQVLAIQLAEWAGANKSGSVFGLFVGCWCSMVISTILTMLAVGANNPSMFFPAPNKEG